MHVKSIGRRLLEPIDTMNETQPEFIKFPKIQRLNRLCIITEKIDGTNAQVLITESGDVFAGSRTRWITPTDDNFGFANWVEGNKETILKLGPGRHFGEWWGLGIQRNYGLKEKRWSLFNTIRWCIGKEPALAIPCEDPTLPVKFQSVVPDGIYVVPELSRETFTELNFDGILERLKDRGSFAVPGFMEPEGIVIYHMASNTPFKMTYKDGPKSV
jgi:hypothetical protein